MTDQESRNSMEAGWKLRARGGHWGTTIWVMAWFGCGGLCHQVTEPAAWPWPLKANSGNAVRLQEMCVPHAVNGPCSIWHYHQSNLGGREPGYQLTGCSPPPPRTGCQPMFQFQIWMCDLLPEGDLAFLCFQYSIGYCPSE